MPVRRIVSPILSFVRWLFSPQAPGVDLALALLGACWLAFMLLHPTVFDTGNYAGMAWLPDLGWIGFLTFTTVLHVIGLIRLDWVTVRVGGGLLAAWFWIMVAISIGRVSFVPGCLTYGIVGAGALLAAIYISGFAREGA